MDYYKEIKQQLINNEIYKSVKDYSKNKNDLITKYNVGKLLSQAGKCYGEGIIKKYSIKLTKELGKGYDITSLKRIRKFYLIIEKGATLQHQLSWSHYKTLISQDDINKINYYIDKIIKCNISVRQLSSLLKTNEYERLDDDTKLKLIEKKDIKIQDFIKHPIIIRNKLEITDITEKVLKKLIIEDLDNFLKELGEGFCYIANEYPIKIGGRYNFIDLLLFNIKYNCYVVIELKITELKKEHIGQIEVYMNYVDKNLKGFNNEKTIGIIIVKKENNFVLEYCSDLRIFEVSFKLMNN